MNYDKFIYKYPPRPETIIPNDSLDYFESLGYIWQPKLNGSCAMLYTSGARCHFMNRHKGYLANKITDNEFNSIMKSNGWLILVGEYMNKGKLDVNNKPFKDKFVIFDILAHNGKLLLGKSIEYRQELLFRIPRTSYDKWISRISDNIFIVNNFYEDMSKNYNEIIKIDMYEGFVGKKQESVLSNGIRPANNTDWQIKVRKPTKNYSM